MIPHEVVYCSTTVSYYNEEVSNYLLPIPTGVFVSFPLTCVHCACEDLVHAYNHQAAFLTLVLCIGTSHMSLNWRSTTRLWSLHLHDPPSFNELLDGTSVFQLTRRNLAKNTSAVILRKISYGLSIFGTCSLSISNHAVALLNFRARALEEVSL